MDADASKDSHNVFFNLFVFLIEVTNGQMNEG